MAVASSALAEGEAEDMTRNHRAAHRLVWPAIGLVAILGFLMALLLRAPAATLPASPPAQELLR
jgi:hypothetical protein